MELPNGFQQLNEALASRLKNWDAKTRAYWELPRMCENGLVREIDVHVVIRSAEITRRQVGQGIT